MIAHVLLLSCVLGDVTASFIDEFKDFFGRGKVPRGLFGGSGMIQFDDGNSKIEGRILLMTDYSANRETDLLVCC